MSDLTSRLNSENTQGPFSWLRFPTLEPMGFRIRNSNCPSCLGPGPSVLSLLPLGASCQEPLPRWGGSFTSTRPLPGRSRHHMERPGGRSGIPYILRTGRAQVLCLALRTQS